MRPRPILLILLFALLLPATADILLATDQAVSVGPDIGFHPATVHIQAGEKVTWTNMGGPHFVVGDDSSFGNSPNDPSSGWTYEHTFPTAGTFTYHCGIHGVYMTGSVVVADVTSEPGTLGFTATSYSVNEGAGQVSIAVQRTGGDDGAASVHYAASAGTATAADFTAVSGTLSWANGDDSVKSFNVPIANDAAAEANETVTLTLSSATGASLDSAHQTAVLTIQDNDTAPGGTPAAPSNLVAAAVSSSAIDLSWTDNSSNEVGFLVERRTVGGSFEEIGATAANTTGYHDASLDPSTFYIYRVRASAGATSSPYSNEASAATLGIVAACIAGPETLCVNNGRFQVEIEWRTPSGTGHGHAVPVPSAPDSGLFYFFSPSNLEMLIKVLNACVPSVGNRYWVFYAATTNIEFALVVTDTQTGKTRAYFNPLNHAAPPVQDTGAFATCP